MGGITTLRSNEVDGEAGLAENLGPDEHSGLRNRYQRSGPINDQVVLACEFDDLAVENDYFGNALLLLLLCVTAVQLCDHACVSTWCGRAWNTVGNAPASKLTVSRIIRNHVEHLT